MNGLFFGFIVGPLITIFCGTVYIVGVFIHGIFFNGIPDGEPISAEEKASQVKYLENYCEAKNIGGKYFDYFLKNAKIGEELPPMEVEKPLDKNSLEYLSRYMPKI